MTKNRRPERSDQEWFPSHAQKQYKARRAAENEAATKAELEEIATDIGVTPRKGRATKADLREALTKAANDEQEN